MKLHSASYVSYFRNFIFGVEDSLVSTVGLLSGVAVANISRETLFVTGVVLILVEAFSMAAGSLMSEYSADSYETRAEKMTRSDFVSAAVMFISYFISGIVPLLPYVLFPVEYAIYVSISASLICLFILGMVGAKVAHIHVWKNAIRMFLVGGMAIAVGVLAGNLLSPVL